MYNNVDALESIIRMVVEDQHPTELRELIETLPKDDVEALSAFCDVFELGNWMYDAMTLNEIDLVSLLYQIADEFDKELKESQIEEKILNALHQ